MDASLNAILLHEISNQPVCIKDIDIMNIGRHLMRNTDFPRIETMILAGGLGTRLRSVVADRPKVLAHVQGRPFLAHLLDRLALVGIKRVILCTGYLGEQIEEEFGVLYGELALAYSREKSTRGTGGALRLALHLVTSNIVLVMNGDSLCDGDLTAMYLQHINRDADITMLLSRTDDSRRYGQVTCDSAGRIIGFNEKHYAAKAGWINGGIYFMKRAMIELIPEARPVSLERDMFPVWLCKAMYGFKSSGDFIDIGTPDSYAAANHF